MMKELKDIPKHNPFRVPDGYFENLTERIVSATASEEQSAKKSRPSGMLRIYLAAAATVAILALIGYAGFYFISENSGRRDLQEIILSELTVNELNEIDLLTLEEGFSVKGPSLETGEISSSEIIDYLVSENIDILEIYEQL